MEEKIAQMKRLLDQALRLYNEVAREKVTIVQDKTIYVGDIYVCKFYVDKYHTPQIGLFKAIKWKNNVSSRCYDSGIIYQGIDSDFFGLQITHYEWDTLNRFEPIGTRLDLVDNTIVSNCEIERIDSFDNLRLKMFQQRLIGPYEIGKARKSELLKVLAFSMKYFGLDDEKKEEAISHKLG